MDFLGFLLAAATAAIVARDFGPVLTYARTQLALNTMRGETWSVYALASILKRVLVAYAVLFGVCSVVLVASVTNYADHLSITVLLSIILMVVGSLVWMGVAFFGSLWSVSYASVRDVWGLGAPVGAPYRMTPQEFIAAHGRKPPSPLSTALQPIFVSMLAFSAVCVWIKFEVAGIVSADALLPIRMASNLVLGFGLASSIGVPVVIGYWVVKAIDPFTDTIFASVFRAIAIALPGITSDSFDRFTNGSQKLDIPLEKLFPGIISVISPPIAVLLTLHSFAMWVGDRLSTAYLTTLFMAGVMAGFSFWAFGVKPSEWPKRIVHALWVIIICSVLFSWASALGITGAASDAAQDALAPDSWLQIGWNWVKSEWRYNLELMHLRWGWLRGVGKGVIYLVFAVIAGLAALGSWERLFKPEWPGKIIAGLLLLPLLVATFVCSSQVLGILIGWANAA